MAQPLQNSFVFVSFFLALSFTVAISSKHNYAGLKSLHFTLYDQATSNKTAYLIVKGVDIGLATSQYSLPFGSLYALHDSLTIKVNRSSEVVGAIEGIIVASSLDGLQAINVLTITLNYKKHKGSISVVGVLPNIAPGDLTVVGGTDDFFFVQGYITSTLTDLTFPNLTFKLDFHLYWPPYATKK